MTGIRPTTLLGRVSPGGAARGNTALVVVARDPASDARLGAAAWDSAVLARVITSLGRAGAVTIGVDALWGSPGAPSRGGAAGDALLSQALILTDSVVCPIALDPAPQSAEASARAGGASAPGHAHPSWVAISRVPGGLPAARPPAVSLPGLAQHARGLGHTLSPTDADGLVRRAPLFVRLEGHAVPAFALALAAAYLNVRPGQITIERGAVVLAPPVNRAPLRIPVDGQGRALIGFSGPDVSSGVARVPFSEVWTAIEEGRADSLRGLVDDRLVLLLVEPARRTQRTPVGAMSDVALQAQLLSTLLGGGVPRVVSPAWTLVVALVVAALAAWVWLAWPWWAGLTGSLVLALAHLGSLPLALTTAVSLSL